MEIPKMTVQDVLNDSDFFMLPLEERRNVLSQIDEDFTKLSKDTQDEILLRESPVEMSPIEIPPEIQKLSQIQGTTESILSDAIKLSNTLNISPEEGLFLRKNKTIWDNDLAKIPSQWQKLYSNAVAGVGMQMENFGGLLERYVSKPAGEFIKNKGIQIKNSFYIPEGKDYTDFKWQNFLDADYLTTHIVPTVSGNLSLIPVYLMGSYLGGGLAASITARLGVQYLFKAIGAGLMGRVMESAMEAQDSYSGALQSGKTEEEADKISNSVFWDNMKLSGLDIGEFLTAFMPVRFMPTGKILSGGIKLLGVGAMEGLEERIQEFIQRKAVNPDLPYTSIFNIHDSRFNESMAIGALLGIGLGGIGTVKDILTSEISSRIPEENLKQTFDTTAREKGIGEAVGELIQTEEGKKIVDTAIENLKTKAEGNQEVIPTEVNKITPEETDVITEDVITEAANDLINEAIKTPVETSKETPIETQGKTPMEISKEIPVETPVETQGKISTETPMETPVETSGGAQGKTPEGTQGEKIQKTRIKPYGRLIYESTALKAAIKKAQQNALIAWREGKREGIQQETEKLKRYLRRANVIRETLKTLNLTERDLKGITKKNPLYLSNYEWKNYLHLIREKAQEIYELKNARSQYYALIEEKQFKKEENYRKALKLPKIENMSVTLLNDYINLLSQYQVGDEFLPQRKLETIDNTDLRNARTVREIREHLAKETGVNFDEIKKTTTWLDEITYDALLRQKDAFLKLLVDGTQREIFNGDANYIDFRDSMEKMAKESQVAWNTIETERSVIEPKLSHDEAIIQYLEATPDEKVKLAEKYPKETLAYLDFLQQYFEEAYEYLVKVNNLQSSRFQKQYYPHQRRSFWETLFDTKNGGLKQAIQELKERFNEDRMVFEILEEQTGDILPLNKFFSNVLWRSGGLTPSKNHARVILNYVQRFERKRALDRIIPKFMSYAQVLTPEEFTPGGLRKNTSLERFVKKYINTKKGRTLDVMIFKQGSIPDMILRSVRTVTSLIDLGFALPIQIGNYIGENVADFVMLGTKKYMLGETRKFTAKGQRIIEKYRNFVGDSLFREFTGIEKTFMDKAQATMLGLFHEASVDANKTFLLGSLTDHEWKTETISSERLAELRGEMGRYRYLQGGRSIWGSTSAVQAFTQYRSWAIPIISQTITNLKNIRGLLTNRTSIDIKSAKELTRMVGVSTVIYVVGSTVISHLEDKDEEELTLLDRILIKSFQDGLSMITAFDQRTVSISSRSIQFINQLISGLQALITELDATKLIKTVEPRIIKEMEANNE